jgi:cyclopropane-fatty-acyl-phospholipid synthase
LPKRQFSWIFLMTMTTPNSATTPQTSVWTLPSCATPAAHTIFKLLKNVQQGTLEVQLPDGSWRHFGEVTPEGTPGQERATIRLKNWKVCSAVLKAGDIGFAETYLEEDWQTPDLSALLRLFLINRRELEGVVYGSWWGSLLYRIRHWLRRNTKQGSRHNIHAHYDLGNEFYHYWLDPSMNYSSAWFNGNPTQDLQSAQRAKMQRALQECQVKPGSRVLEIGCGWGAVAECAARDFGAPVTGVTLSNEQLDWGRQRLQKAGLSGDLRFQDYRDLNEPPFDAIVSIEMFEAVGRAYWDAYFQTVHRQLSPHGRACIQTITIRDDLFDRYAQSTDFIQQYIFPGGMLPSRSQFVAAAERAGLKVINELAFGKDYAETLRQWRAEFVRQHSRWGPLGFDARFCRIWEFYLAYCEAAFETGNTNVVQFTLAHA